MPSFVVILCMFGRYLFLVFLLDGVPLKVFVKAM